MKKIIAVVGMCGAGKSVASDFLEKQGFFKIYFGGVTLDKMREEGIDITPENEKKMREDLRKQYGMGCYATLLLPKIKASAERQDTVLDGLYSWDELKILREEFQDQLTVIAVTLDRELRYHRLSVREIRPLTKAEAQARDLAEIENLAKGGPIAFADYYIDNNGTIADYQKRLTDILNQINRGEKNEH